MNTQYQPAFKSGTFRSGTFARVCSAVVCWAFGILAAQAQIVIGGDVYGGGLNGAVGTEGNTSGTTVVVNDGAVRTVFGGGENGRVYGNTDVDINGGIIGAEALEGTPYGGVYGGGEGAGAVVTGSAEVTVNGGDNFNNVYGGGKQALLTGYAHVILKGGQVRNNVFAGACMANIDGYALVDIQGGSANPLLVKAVYGGNDISGSILNTTGVRPDPDAYTFRVTSGLPTKLESYVFAQSTATNAFIGNVFGGGNGAYEYEGSAGNLSVTMNDPEAVSGTITFGGLPNQPDAPRAYLQIEGGTYGNIYGGGNKATISERTDIYFGIGMSGDSYADVAPMGSIPVEALDWLDLYEGYTLNGDGTTFKMNYNACRIFGGNNIAEMAIRPHWHLKSGMVGNIYSGGNQGRMTYEKGLFLPLTSNYIKVNNVYGGCRMADVNPGGQNGTGTIAAETVTYHRFKHADGDGFGEAYDATYDFAAGYAARVLVLAGQINNLYGGNDISGKVYYGTNVELRGAIAGDVYGGGNGSYAYTDNADWIAAHPQDADYYYDPGSNSLDSLYKKRPHVEKTLLHITGIGAAAPPVYVTGGVYCGGNSATLNNENGDAHARFMIGQNVIINGVFMGSNGENMIKTDGVLDKYASLIDGKDFSSLDLTNPGQFAEYMKGVAVNLKPEIVWEWDDEDPNVVPGGYGQPGHKGIQSYIGSFYCGGNVGSMTTPRQMVMNFPRCLTVYDRVVGGCNAANITASPYNAAHEGGVTNERTNGLEREPGVPKVVLNVHSRLEPRELVATFDSNGFITGTPVFNIDKASYTYGGNDYSILNGANIYAGCYQSGYINGDVAINITRDLVSPEIPAADMQLDNQAFLDDAGEDTAMPFAYYVFSNAMNVYGGGYGKDTEIRGNAAITLDADARVMKVFGGGEMGTVRDGATVTLAPTLKKPADAGLFNAYMVYGGGYEGTMGADVRVLLHGGRVYDVYGGSCNADINGGTYVEVGDGSSGKLHVANSVYGANDFGGLLGSRLWNIGTDRNVRSQTHVLYRSGAVENEIYGGSYGSYDYTKFTRDDAVGFSFPKQDEDLAAQLSDPSGTEAYNTFVQVAGESVNPADYVKGAVYGGGRGYGDATGIVDVHDTYVYLHASPVRTAELVATVYGGGYYSKVENTLVDALSGRVGTLYGGTAGMSAADFTNHSISYNAGTTCVNLYDTMRNPDMDVFGAGSLAGAATTHVYLYGGEAANIYGGSFAEGICTSTNVHVPELSTAVVKALYGGSKGMSAGLPCDVEEANISVLSGNAYVRDTIFGGNHAYRAVKRTDIDIRVPVRMEPDGDLVNVYAGGNGAKTIAGTTHVLLRDEAELMDVYGGGKSGQVLNAYDGALAAEVEDYYAVQSHPTWTATDFDNDIYKNNNTFVELRGGELRNAYAGGFAGLVQGNTYLKIGERLDAPTHAEGRPTVQRSAYGGGEMAEVSGTATVDMYDGYIGYAFVGGKYEPMLNLKNDNRNLLKENGNLYGAGYGEGAVVMDTRVNLFGGTIRNGLYGGGEIAAVGKGEITTVDEKPVLDNITAAGETHVCMYGGTVEGDVFGGGRGFSYDLTGNLVTGKIYYTDGYVFGTTGVKIYRGTIGTDASLAEGHGNVFGGGNIGYVYGPGVKYTGTTDSTKINGHYYTDNTFAQRTEDCCVEIEARCVALETVTINGNTYDPGHYVTNADLNTLTYDSPLWAKLDTEGVTIRNAVFAGGNVSSGSDKIYANAVTVYGNATAAVIDVFAKDFVRLGGEHVGGLYGDGNLTFVDGYRELNITNYGTDYYNLSQELSYDDYLKLTDREKEYYTLMYELTDPAGVAFTYLGVTYQYTYSASSPVEINNTLFKTMVNAWVAKNLDDMKWTESGSGYASPYSLSFEHNGESYSYTAGSMLDAAAYEELVTAYAAWLQTGMEAKWSVQGVCAITAGRMMNTIQRADFCGVFGSRMVLHGAQDRVPDVVDYTNYTINRVDEVSLNHKTIDETTHGNYFGIYNVVNFLGAFTSDVEFSDPRVAEEELDTKYGTTTYREFKNHNLNNRTRNNATSRNMVALASGAYLELVKELDGNGNKVYGPVTGVIQLDMINVQPGEGGGYVYARNEHGNPQPVSEEMKKHLTLSEANKGAITQTAYTYDPNVQLLMQTSGNFVHPQKRIVDDCFPRGGYYNQATDGSNYSPAHYWYIRGNFYVYDQYLSAYTGAAQAYPQSVNIPLTITAGSEGRMELVGVNPSKYAYFVGKHYKDRILDAGDSILVGTTTYRMNDPISYWDWSQLSITDQSYFVDETYVAICDATAGTTEYEKGHVLLPEEYRDLLAAYEKVDIISLEGEDHKAPTDSVFRISNELSHDAGYLLTFDITNPLEWDDYFTTLDAGTTHSILETAYDGLPSSEQNKYIEGPTMLCTTSGIYGQRHYAVDDIVNQTVIDSHAQLESAHEAELNALAATKPQAEFQRAYVVTGEISFTIGTQDYHMYENSYMSEGMYNSITDATVKTSIKPAYVCTNTIEVADKEYILFGELISATRYEELQTATGTPGNAYLYNKKITDYFLPAHVCTTEGSYGGTYFQKQKNYHALQFSELPEEERNAVNASDTKIFQFNYDALDLLATDFNPLMKEYDGPRADTERLYSVPQAVNYSAKYIGKDESNTAEVLNYKVRVLDTDGEYKGKTANATLTEGTESALLERVAYESILNEQAHFVPVNVTHTDSTYYIVKGECEKANIYYPVGKVISEEEYNLLTADQKDKVEEKTFTATGIWYYCTEDFILSDVTGKTGELNGKTALKLGDVISKATFDTLPNYQRNFVISGHSPVETSTLYVPRESDILNLSEDRVVTVVYKYTYREGSADGGGYEVFVEKHVVNIHIQFKSGLPTIGDVTPPAPVLPNSTVGLSVPTVTKGAYEILGGGWEMFETLSDATEHKNGVEYKNNATPMYWYQNNYYVSYYAKTYLGKAYSTPVPFSVANYHRMGEVMHHDQRMFIDHKDVDRASKIYLDEADYESTSIAYDKGNKNDLDYLYDLYQETKAGKTSAADPYEFNSRIENGANLEFILRSDIAPKVYTDWQQPGASLEDCFAGNFHGDGHTVKGLNKSLFGYLCGTVYNTGVTGTFTGGGVADHNGTAVNCWVKTSGTPAASTYAVIGNAATDTADVNVINSYYDAANGFKAGGMATPRDEADFVRGEVAYDLNRYYLEARRGVQTGEEAKRFEFYMRQADGTIDKDAGLPILYQSFYHTDNTLDRYVEDNIMTGDFRYAGGEIPLEADIRFHVDSMTHYPVYPDDYLFFGQQLSYEDATHQVVPQVLIADEDGLVEHNHVSANRVYRAPAYRKSSTLNAANPVVYYNRYAAFAGEYGGKQVDADLTAIDFTGNAAKETEAVKTAVVYTPLLDYEGVKGFHVKGITQNLLVYADAENDAASHSVLAASLPEPAFDYNESGMYKEVGVAAASDVKGHLVDKRGAAYESSRNHFLVDKQDFNAPLAYTFSYDDVTKDGNFMWYQRTPATFVDGTAGWESLCLPFTAHLVSAHEKGEITHFYGADSNGLSGNKAHEYWLRAPTQIATEGGVTSMVFARPEEGDSRYVTGDYTATNSFLYESYYQHQDENYDSYQNSAFNQNATTGGDTLFIKDNHGNYYRYDRPYDDYIYLSANVPYIIGFPGVRYYEFDMSGAYKPEHIGEYVTLPQLGKQTVSYVSKKGAAIGVSDEQETMTTVDGYTYTGSFVQKDITDSYVMNVAGSAFETSTAVAPFRTYISKISAGVAPKRILIGKEQQQSEQMMDDKLGNLYIYGKNGAIHIESTLEVETQVTIHTIGGVVVKQLYVLPGAHVSVPVQSRGIYIVNRKKVTVY